MRGVVLQEARAEEQILHLNIGVQNTWDQVTFSSLTSFVTLIRLVHFFDFCFLIDKQSIFKLFVGLFLIVFSTVACIGLTAIKKLRQTFEIRRPQRGTTESQKQTLVQLYPPSFHSPFSSWIKFLV